ncbi:proline--tRNA ligase [Helicobacter sp. T3_23-1056]
MLFSKMLLPTSKESPKDAILKSHQYLVRAGYIHQIGSGIYNFLPLGKIVLEKISQIVRNRLGEAGAQEVLLSFVTPEELWQKSGRSQNYGKELLRFSDRKNTPFLLAPTHEESITELAKTYIKSYKSLPLNLYQIQLKFRDELRPRFGLLRTREFIMKDGYSFHANSADLDREFDLMYKTYSAIFSDLGLDFRCVEADSGAIGGSGSKEFMVLASSGEDTLAVCKNCEYAANLEVARRAKRLPPRDENGNEILPPKADFAKFSTPNVKSISDLCAFFHINPFFTIKAVVKKYTKKPCNLESTSTKSTQSTKKDSAQNQYSNQNLAQNPAILQEDFAVFFLRGDDELEEIKALNALNANGFNALELLDASEGELENIGLIAGSIGAYSLRAIIGERAIIFDNDLNGADDMICGANEREKHFVGVDLDTFENLVFADLAVVKEGDICADCGGKIIHKKGIEVGHIFKLGDKYSAPLQAKFLDENGREKPFIMGCYGIGISRILSAILEQKADEKGCVWSRAVAPFALQIIIANIKDKIQYDFALTLYESLKQVGVEVALDDRDLRFGAKMADFELMGSANFALIVGKGLESNRVEIIKRDGLQKSEIDSSSVLERVLKIIK